MIVVVPVLVFVSFSFGEVSMDSPVQSKCIGIISAMQSEVNLLLSQANIERIDTVGKVDYHVGTLRDQQVVIAKAGVGKVLAASEMTVMLNRYPVTEVIFTGVAGGVGDETQVLDEVVATRLIQHDYSSCTKLYEIAVRRCMKCCTKSVFKPLREGILTAGPFENKGFRTCAGVRSGLYFLPHGEGNLY